MHRLRLVFFFRLSPTVFSFLSVHNLASANLKWPNTTGTSPSHLTALHASTLLISSSPSSRSQISPSLSLWYTDHSHYAINIPCLLLRHEVCWSIPSGRLCCKEHGGGHRGFSCVMLQVVVSGRGQLCGFCEGVSCIFVLENDV